MTRSEYLQRQKADKGRKILAVFPIHYPGEVLTALDIAQSEVWDVPGLKPVKSAGRMQAYICTVAHLGLEWILTGGTDTADALLFPHTCDSLQNLWSIVADYVKPGKPVLLFNQPKGDPRGSARAFYRGEVERLIGALAPTFGPLRDGRLAQAVVAHNRALALLAELYDLRRAGRLDAPANEFYTEVRAREYLWVDDLADRWRAFRDARRLADPPAAKGIPIVLSGTLPHPPEMLSHIEQCGGRIVDDDLASCGRRLYPVVPFAEGDDPLDAIVERHFASPPCSTIGNSQARRFDALAEKVRAGGAKGVVFVVVKFCEPELFDIPAMTAGLKKRGIPSLAIEIEVNGGFPAQAQTRIEAFLEMIGGGGVPAGRSTTAAAAGAR